MTEEAQTPKHLGVGWEAQLLFALTLILLAFGIVTLYSSSTVWAERLGLPPHYFALTQASGALIGLLLLATGYLLPYQLWQKIAWPLLGLCIVSLLLLVIPGTQSIAPEVNGARRWLRLGGFRIQPSEVAKLALIVWTATLVTRKHGILDHLQHGVLPLFAGWIIIAGLIYIEPNVSTALFTLLLAITVGYAGGVRIRHILLLVAIAVLVIAARIDSLGYFAQRLQVFLDTQVDPAGAGYQIKQSLIAMGSGGVFGRGFGASQQKYGYLPEPHNDFILAMIGEEWGFAGILVVGLLFLAIVAIGFRIARQAPDLFGYLLAVGFTVLIGFHVVLHMGVNLGLLPTTGIALPMFSYGRSGLIVMLLGIGILMNIARASIRRAET